MCFCALSHFSNFCTNFSKNQKVGRRYEPWAKHWISSTKSKVNVQKEEIRSLNYNVKRFGEPTRQKVYALVTHTAFCQCRRTKTNTTAQRPYQGGFTIRNKLNNVSQISKEVLNFVEKLMGGSRLSEHWQLNPETVGSIPFSFSVCLICWMQPWVKDAGAQDWGQYNCSAKPAASIPTVMLTLSWGLYLLVCPYT